MNKTTLIKSRRTRAAQVKKQSAHRISSPQGKRQKNAKWKRLAGACLVSCFVVFVIVCIYGSFRIHNKVVNQVKDYRENSNQKASTTTSSRKDAIIRSLEKGQPAAAPSTSAGSSTGKILLKIFGSPFCSGNVEEAKMESTGPLEYTPTILPKSVQVYGAGLVEVYNGPKQEYKGTVMELEGCVDFYDLMEKQESKFVLFTEATVDKVLTSKQQIPKQLQESFATTKDLSKPHTRFVFSATSSEYFGYQVFANALGFLQSKQTDASWTRLLSSSQPDDLSERFPTFTAPRSLYSEFYKPINKADVIDKWFHSKDAPHPDDTIVVIDPDNWLINDVHDWAAKATSKHGMAQVAYYGQNKHLHDLWAELCRHNCNVKAKPTAVPYILKASDLKEVAPLWRKYSIDIKERFKNNETFKSIYGPALGVRWAAEMFGYNFACAHLNIDHTIVHDLQIRDVDGGKRKWDILRNKMPMIHVGRAWFPAKDVDLAAPWRHKIDNEPENVKATGIQVWCKCNNTAARVQPWPLPEDMDFVSYHTLRLLHESVERFGPVPHNDTFRRKQPVMYSWSAP